MEENFYKDEFEVFLKDQADSNRMFPSDSVWRNIQTKLHPDEKWPGLTMTAFVLLAVIIAVSVYFSPGPNVFAYKVSAAQKSSATHSGNELLTMPSQKQTGNSWKYSGNDVEKNTSNPIPHQEAPADNKQLASSTVKPTIVNLFTSATNSSFKRTTSNYAPLNSLVNNRLIQLPNDPIEEAIAQEKLSTTPNIATPPSIENQAEKGETEKQVIDKYLSQHPLDIADITSSKSKLPNKFSYEVYIAPSASFRKLTEDRSANDNAGAAGPRAINYIADVNKIVRHSPGTGIEVGVSFGYDLTTNLKLTSAFQFNIRQYIIEAYSSSSEVATIALRTNSGIDSVTRTSVYRTSSGYSPTQLVNRYYQVSIPVGLQWKVIGSKNIALNVAGSLQPTYTLNKNAYLLSTNFKNYAESGGMLRSWNVNTNVEAFLSIKSGSYKWQIGPQFRYQQLPTFTDQYPIKEHLLDYGVKLGISKSIQ